MKGETLITTDGTTLLGADDKAGVAEILTALRPLSARAAPTASSASPLPRTRRSARADLFDIPGFGADFAYTVDGGDAGDIEYENFNAAAATVTIHGFSVHPGSAKDTMINASNVAMEFHGALPVTARPETTEGRQGFYHLCQMYGDVTTAKLGYILRDHDAAKLQFKKDNMQDIADYLNGKYGAGTVEVEIRTATATCWKDQAPLPSGGDRPQGCAHGRSGAGGGARARRHRWRHPELDGSAPAPIWALAASTSTACASAPPWSGWTAAPRSC